MAGDAFDIQAVRLTPSAFTQLCAHIEHSLAEVDVAIPPSLLKDSHGDVGVLVPTTLSGLKGRAIGGPAETLKLAESEAAADVDGVCAALCAKVGARKWSRNGRIVSLAVPLHFASTKPQKEGEEDKFHQVDLILIPAPSLSWARMTMTFGQTRQLLKLLCRAALGSNRVRIHDTYLGFNTPQPPLKPRKEIELSTSPSALCSWLGIEPYGPLFFQRTPVSGTQSAAGMEKLFIWLGSAPPTALAWHGYQKLVQQWKDGTLPREVAGKGNPNSKRQQKLQREDDTADAFCQWLAVQRKGDFTTQRAEGREDVEKWRKKCPELTDEEISLLLFFDKTDEYLSTQAPPLQRSVATSHPSSRQQL